jgi:hypothetical protein
MLEFLFYWSLRLYMGDNNMFVDSDLAKCYLVVQMTCSSCRLSAYHLVTERGKFDIAI